MLPKAVYQLLPYCYLAIAFALIVFTEHPLRWLPGIFFALSGLMVMRWRIQARKEQTINETE